MRNQGIMLPSEHTYAYRIGQQHHESVHQLQMFTTPTQLLVACVSDTESPSIRDRFAERSMAKDLRNKGSFPLFKDEGDPSSTSIAKDPQTAIYDPSVRDSMLRKGKWTTEEEDYATKIISLFNRGLLHIGAGTTLRSYLSDKLHWYEPMHGIRLHYIYNYLLR